MKKLLLVLLLLPVALSAQIQTWKIKGALAALNDTVPAVNIKALDKLIDWGVLDSLVHAHAIPQKIFDYCRKESHSAHYHSISVEYLLSCQEVIPPEDLAGIRARIFRINDEGSGEMGSAIHGLSKGRKLRPELAELFRSAWNKADFFSRGDISRALGTQPVVPREDLALLKSHLEESLELSAVGSGNPALQAYLSRSPLPDGISDLIASLAGSNDTMRELLFHTLSETDPFDPRLAPVYRSVKKGKPSAEYYECVAKWPFLTEQDFNEVVSYINGPDYPSYSLTLPNLVSNPVMKGRIADLLVTDKYLKKGYSSMLDIATSLSDSIVNIPEISQAIRKIPDGKVEENMALINLYARQQEVSDKDIQRMHGLFKKCGPTAYSKIFSKLQTGSLHEKVLALFWQLGESQEYTTRDAVLRVLAGQDRLSDGWLTLFAKQIKDRSQGSGGIVASLARQEPMEEGAIALLSKVMDTSAYFFEAGFVSIMQRSSVPAELWPVIYRHIDWIRMTPNFRSDAPIPERFSFLYANQVIYNPDRDQYPNDPRWNAYVNGNGSPALDQVMQWIGLPEKRLPSVDDPKLLFLGFDTIWDAQLKDCNNIKKDLSARMSRILSGMGNRDILTMADVLSDLQNKLEKDGYTSDAAFFEKKLAGAGVVRNKVLRFLSEYWYLLLLHPLCWALLIFLYPKNTKVQSLFFWNKTVRKWAGLGYVNLLLLHVPYLRNKLFYPFRESLSNHTIKEDFKLKDFFPGQQLRIVKNQEITGVDSILKMKGQIILRGESGTGKTMLLKRILYASKTLSVFLTADQCRKGIEEAITGLIAGVAQDDEIIRSMLFNGYMDLYIDGVNEVGPETRIVISQFITRYSGCRCFISTQPIYWEMPGSATVVDVMPLDAKAISSFLHSRFETYHLPPGIDRPAYEALCDAFLEKHIGEKVPEERRKINQRILSNPFDLTIAGQLIAGAGGRSLNILSLQQEYYDQMTRAFTQTNPHRQAFPIERFSEAVFQLMLKDDARLPYDDFPEEIACMRLFKMVVSREIKDGEDKSWYFRHDKIRDFFVLQVFVEHGEHQVTYIGDPRFRGVYFLLAGYLPLEQAEELERELVIYAGESNDYSLSSEFIRHMRDRRKRTA